MIEEEGFFFVFVFKLSHCYFFMPGEKEEEEEEEKALSTDIDEPLLYFEYIKLANIAMNIANNVKPTNITIAHCWSVNVRVSNNCKDFNFRLIDKRERLINESFCSEWWWWLSFNKWLELDVRVTDNAAAKSSGRGKTKCVAELNGLFNAKPSLVERIAQTRAR